MRLYFLFYLQIMSVLSSNLTDNSILIRINCRTNLFLTDDDDDDFKFVRVFLTDSGFYLNAPLNIYLTRDSIVTIDEKYPLDEYKIEDFIENNENENADRNEPYRKVYPWQIITGKLLRYTTGDESCYTPTIEKCQRKQKQKRESKLLLF